MATFTLPPAAGAVPPSVVVAAAAAAADIAAAVNIVALRDGFATISTLIRLLLLLFVPLLVSYLLPVLSLLVLVP